MDLNQSSALLAATVNLAVAIAILLRDRQRRLYVRFAVLALNLSAWHAASFFFRALGSQTALQIRFAAGVLVPVSVLSVFTLLITVRSKIVEPLKRTVLIASLLISALALTPYFQRPWADALASTFAAASLFATFQLVWYRSRSAQQRTDKVRLRTLVIGGAATSLLAVGDSFAGTSPLPTIGHISIAIYMYFLYQTIITSRLIDVAELIAKAAVLFTLTMLLGGLLELLVLWVGTGSGQFLFNTFIASFVILILYDQIRPWIEARTIRLIFRERDAFSQTVIELLPKLRSTIDVRAVINTALDALYNSRRLTHAAVYLVRDQELGFMLIEFRGPRPPATIDPESTGAFFNEAARQKVPLLRENFERKLMPDADGEAPSEAERARAAEVLTTFTELGAQVVLPLLSGQEVLGLLCLGDARIAAAFPADEIALAYQVADQIAVSVENSAEFERMRERDRLAALGEMSAGLAHEIRNPLGAIQGAAQVLQPDRFPEETRELLSVIVEEVGRLNNVVSQFLEYARPNKTSLVPTDINLVVQRTLTLFSEQVKTAGVGIATQLAEDLPRVSSDADQLRQVLLNLLLNSVEAFEGKTGHIDVSTRVAQRGAGSVVELRVRDNGPGMEPDNLRRIFVPFFTTKARGTGLGLAICQRIISTQGGRIEVASRPAAGTTFTIRLPGVAS